MKIKSKRFIRIVNNEVRNLIIWKELYPDPWGQGEQPGPGLLARASLAFVVWLGQSMNRMIKWHVRPEKYEQFEPVSAQLLADDVFRKSVEYHLNEITISEVRDSDKAISVVDLVLNHFESDSINSKYAERELAIIYGLVSYNLLRSACEPE